MTPSALLVEDVPVEDGPGRVQRRALRTRVREILRWLAPTWLLPGGLTLLAT